jgi:hypothetical protein
MSTDIACGRSAYVACSRDADDRVEVSTNPDLVDPGFVHVSVTQESDSNEVVLTKASALFLADQLKTIASSLREIAPERVESPCSDGRYHIVRVRFTPTGSQYCYWAPLGARVGDALKVTTTRGSSLVEIVDLGRGFYEGTVRHSDAWFPRSGA